jgi:hypothetical protein
VVSEKYDIVDFRHLRLISISASSNCPKEYGNIYLNAPMTPKLSHIIRSETQMKNLYQLIDNVLEDRAQEKEHGYYGNWCTSTKYIVNAQGQLAIKTKEDKKCFDDHFPILQKKIAIVDSKIIKVKKKSEEKKEIKKEIPKRQVSQVFWDPILQDTFVHMPISIATPIIIPVAIAVVVPEQEQEQVEEGKPGIIIEQEVQIEGQMNIKYQQQSRKEFIN